MEMHVDPQVVRAERRKRAWSQEHLAHASGLGLRTIQRIEASGVASNESASALAAVLSLPLSQLAVPATGRKESVREVGSRSGILGLGAAAVAGVGAVSALSFAFADEIALDVGVSISEEEQEEAIQVAMTKLLVEDGDDADFQIDDVARFIVTPAVREDGRILIAVQVFEFDGSDYVKTREPRVLTENGTPTEIVFGSSSGSLFRISLTPDESNDPG